MASTRRTIRKTLVEIIENKTVTSDLRYKACRLLLKETLVPKGKPRGRAFAKKRESTAVSVASVFSDSSNGNGGKSVPREEFLKAVGLR
jgi:hypothetical protein